MLAGLPWTTWLLLIASPLLGMAIILPFYWRNRPRQDDARKGGARR